MQSMTVNQESTVVDILSVLKKLPMTSELLVKTKIVVNVKEAKKEFSENKTIQSLSKTIISDWKQIYVSAQQAQKKNEEPSKPVPTAPKPSATPPPYANGGTPEPLPASVKNYPEGRKKVVELLSECFNDLDIPTAQEQAVAIEEAINGLHAFGVETKAYQAKARSLVFNLRKNKDLRAEILVGALIPSKLVCMSTDDLATSEQRMQRLRASKDDLDSRRSDYMQLHRDEILRENGIDPSKGGEFTCRKCNGNKTTHSAFQLRSSDEPMTLFVSCLTCGNRWKQ